MNHSRTVIALGYFDGIHIGHGKLLEKTKQRADALGCESAVLTFDTHPDTFVKKVKVDLINSAADRVYLIKKYYGIDKVYFLHFNEATMRMDWQEFIERIIAAYGVVHFVVGHDFSFGYMGKGTASLLREYCAAHGLDCDVIPAVTKDGIVISSTYIRSLIAAGEIERANDFLGHPHVVTGTVRSGYHIGRTIDAPTINITLQENVIVPRFGVYATKVILPDGAHFAVTNVGTRPTFNGSSVTVETNILDYDGDLYGENVCIEFFAFLRPEIKFSSAEELTEQIKKDVQRAKSILKETERAAANMD